MAATWVPPATNSMTRRSTNCWTAWPVTAEADPLARPPRMPRAPRRRQSPAPGGTYTLVNPADGRRYPLRVGINTVGRFAENDIVLDVRCVSRRHCAVVVHATGGCEVYDTASRNHTLVNRQVVDRGPLLPGDVLYLAGQRFLVAWVGTDGRCMSLRRGRSRRRPAPAAFLRRAESGGRTIRVSASGA